MKRRTSFKTNDDDRARRGDVVSKNAKKLTKKKVEKSPASSILGLKKDKVDATSEGRSRWSSDEGDECQRLRQQLERVLVDHQRQEEEIVALRALAKSLKEEVEAIQERQQLQNSTCSDKAVAKGWQRVGSHEFFKLDVQIEKLEGENTELCRQLEDSQEELQRARAYIADKLPVYKLAAVKANAEIRCVKSQLQQEREHSDRLRKQLVKYKARQDDVLVRALPERGNNQDEHDDDDDFQESEAVRREREAFFRQCMRLQDSCILEKRSQSELDVFETRKAELADFESTAIPNSEVTTCKLIHEDLLGLNFYDVEMKLSPMKSSKPF